MNENNDNPNSTPTPPPEDPMSRVALDIDKAESPPTPTPSAISTPPNRWLLIAFLLVLALGLSGWLVWRYWSVKVETLPIRDTNIEPPVAPGADDIDTSNWETYRNEKYGFEFRYPQDHILQIYSRGHDPYIFGDGVIAEDTNPEILVIAKNEDEANYYEPVVIKMIADSLNDQQLANSDLKEINFADRKAYLKSGDLDSEYKTVYLEISGGHWITFENTQSSTSILLDQILSTFRFLE